MLDRIAILGATGFLGNRLVEHFHIAQKAEAVPIVNRYASIARLSRFDINWKVSDLTNVEELAKAFSGCQHVVHSATADPDVIRSLIDPIYFAAEKAGVKRIVFLSTAAVHGQNPEQGTTEWSPLPKKHIFEYNAAKVDAERRFLELRAKGAVEVVILRPSVIYGPRFSWVTQFANNLMQGNAYWINQGMGVFNGVFVDNLIHAIEQAIIQSGDGQAFLVHDNELTRWLDFYGPIAKSLGYSLDDIHELKPGHYPQPGISERALALLQHSKAAKAIKPYTPGVLKRMAKACMHAIPKPQAPDLYSLPEKAKPRQTLEMDLLYQNHWKYPNDKAQELLKYNPPFSFQEGISKTIAWLKFAGYPVQTHEF